MRIALSRGRRGELCGAVFLLILLILDQCFPPPVPGRQARHASLVVARDGSPLRAFPDGKHVWRHAVRLDDVSPVYVEAVLAYEDRFFRWHPGINPWALLRAAGQWAMAGRIVSGGSTLSMQVARILEPQPRTAGGKLRQIVRALQLELRLSKDEILTLYLNYAPMGGVLEGVEAASRAYLGKPSARLSAADAALLTVLPQAPSLLRPDRFAWRARAARDKVLRRMSARWGEAVITEALQEPVVVPPLRLPLLAPILSQRVQNSTPRTGRIATTIDVAAQSTLELLLLDRVGRLPAHVSIAALVMDNATLEVLAYAGSADFADPERASHVDMVRAVRSPGSTLKPFLYGLALDEGLIHSESLLADVAQNFGGYQPGNFQQSFHGPVSVSEALVKSLNVPAVEVLERLDPKRFVAALRRGGVLLEFPRHAENAEPNLSVILGGAGTTLEHLVGAYSALARQGLAGMPRLTPDAPRIERRMLSEGAAFIIRDILESGGAVGRAVDNGPGARRGIAWKTGTSFGFRDAWAIGVADRLTVGLWVGRPDGTPNPGFFGANVAAPLLVDIFSALDPAPPQPRIPPATVSQENICWPLGTRYTSTDAGTCHERRRAWILNGVTPPTFHDRLRGGEARYHYFTDASGLNRMSPACGTNLQVHHTARWPAVLEPWLAPGLRRRVLPPPWAAGCQGQIAPESKVKIVGLPDGTILHQARRGDAPLVRLDVRGVSGPVRWLINGRQVAMMPAGGSLPYRFTEAGRYDITAIDEQGGFDRVSVSVR